MRFNDRKQAIDNAVAKAAKIAQSGADLIRSESDYDKLFQTFSKATEQQSKNRVLGALDKLPTATLMKLRGVSGLAQPTLLNFPPGRTPHSYSIRDQATSSLHELAHTKGVFDPETYGYDTVYQLSSGSALENAESYAFFANGFSQLPG
ncbi:peptidase M35 deuterolysin [Aspergillus oryzae]|uniref:deuterolysin n=1 Tax=Aspergillus oryzae TaxID=5062 RepID=A0A1S9D7G2_ASPOZ|nr:peptidase M35 deuterolysin [Aspergillus oryzae]